MKKKISFIGKNPGKRKKVNRKPVKKKAILVKANEVIIIPGRLTDGDLRNYYLKDKRTQLKKEKLILCILVPFMFLFSIAICIIAAKSFYYLVNYIRILLYVWSPIVYIGAFLIFREGIGLVRTLKKQIEANQ